jgi:hypothetical protein
MFLYKNALAYFEIQLKPMTSGYSRYSVESRVLDPKTCKLLGLVLGLVLGF